MDNTLVRPIDMLNESQVRKLLDISNLVNSTLDLDLILQTVVDTIAANTVWSMACIANVDEDKEEVRFIAQRGFRDEKSNGELRWSLDVSLTPKSIKTGKTIIVEDVLKLKEFPIVRSSVKRNGYRSLLIVPLLNVKPDTALWLCTPTVTKFKENEIIFAECLASQVAIAFRNALLYEQSQSQANELIKINYKVNELLNMVIERYSPETIRDTAAELTENPIWFEDQFGQRIPAPDGPPAPDAMEQAQPIHFDSEGRQSVAIPVVSGTEHFGWLLTWDSVKPFKETDISFLRQTALVFSLVFLKERVRHEVESQIRTDLFFSLVSSADNNTKPDVILTQRARALRVELPQPARVALIDFQVGMASTDLNYRDKLARAATSITRWLPNRLVALQDQYIAILLSPGEEQLICNHLGELNYFFSNALPLIAVGEIAQNTNQYGESLASAFKVLKATHFLRLKGPVILSEALGIYSILFDPKRQGELESHSRKILGELLAGDHQGTYWETIDRFFELNCHIDATAKSLNIHISTLRYRLERIQTLFGIDWHRADTRLQIHISIVVEKWKRSQGRV